MAVQPLSDRVVVQPSDQETTSQGGIVIPGNAAETPAQGKVLAVGPGKDGNPVGLNVGDVVLYGQYAGTKVKVKGDELLIMREDDVLAVLKD